MSTGDSIAVAAAIMGTALTVFAIIIGVGAFWGIAGLRAAAKNAAEEEARRQVVELISPHTEVGRRLREEIEKRIDSVADQLYADMSLSAAFPQSVRGEKESDHRPSARNTQRRKLESCAIIEKS
jgi:hypothetical protein